MLPIKKGSRPRELTEAIQKIKSTPSTVLSWKYIDSATKQVILRSLLEEQNGLCAYCERKIDEVNAHVEHIKPQSAGHGRDDLDSVDYRNMLAVCDGFEGDPAGLTCDRSRGNAPLKVNPLKPDTLKNIRYRRNGVILSKDKTIDNELNDVLNLNQQMLVRSRYAALEQMYIKFNKIEKKKGSAAVARFCSRYIEDHLHDAKQRAEYDGILIYFMQRRARC